METKVCASCGQEKSTVDFRRYYGGRKGTYTNCKECEKIESRRRYLESKESLNQAQRNELDKIIQLYDLREKAGLHVPGRRRNKADNTVASIVDRYLNNEDV